MQLFVGTSGYSYKEWKGSFYPEDLAASKMLPYYADRFSTVEINNTFYRMPTAKLLEGWAAQVPPTFTFALKAPQRITHQKRFVEADDDIRQFAEVASVLGGRLGPLLFQLPPFAKKETGKLRTLFSALDAPPSIALEFRNASWFDDETYELLQSHDAALCVSDTDEEPFNDDDRLSTATWGYVRLRRSEYGEGELERWRERIANAGWTRAFVFFKHEDEGKGPKFARQFLDLVERA